MDTSKLHEALNHLRVQHKTITEAITAIENAIKLLDGNEAGVGITLHKSPAPKSQISEPRSYIDDAVAALERNGGPMHARDLVAAVSEIRGKTVSRPSFESTIIRHMKDSKHPRLVRVGPSVFGIAEPTPTLDLQ